MLNSVRKLTFRNAFNMCKRSFAEVIGDDAYAADLSFNGTVLINIRQYYQKDDNTPIMASKKGIALTLQQWEQLMTVAPAITDAARKLATTLPPQPKSDTTFNPKPYKPDGNQNSPQGSYKYQNRNYYQNNGQQQQGNVQQEQAQAVKPAESANNTFKGTF